MSKELEVIPRGQSGFKNYDMEHMFQLFLQTHGPYAPLTIANKKVMFGNLMRFLDGAKPTKQLLMEWEATLRVGTAKHNQYTTTAKQILRWMYKVGYLEHNDADVLEHRRMPTPKEQPIWTNAEYETMKAFCATRSYFQTHRFLIILAYRTGMSLVDCCHLRWRDVHLNDNGPSYIDIYRIKTQRLGGKALCQIPIIPKSDLHQALLARKAVEHLNYKRFDGITDFVHQDAPGLYSNTMRKIGEDFRCLFQRCGINWKGDKTFRHFRNTFVSNLVNSGMQLALLSKVTGHNNLQTLLLYLKADRYALQEGISKAYEYSERSHTPASAPIIAPDPEAGPAQISEGNPAP